MITVRLPKPPLRIHVRDIVSSWDPGFMPHTPRSYVDQEEQGKIRALKDRISELEYQLENERQVAFQQGYQDGTEAVVKDARTLTQTLPVRYSQMTESIKDQLNEELKRLREPLLDFAIGVAAELLGSKLTVEEHQQQLLTKNISEFLDKVRTQTRILIRVNPEQLDWVTRSDVVSLMNASVKDHVRFLRDPDLNPGECILETEDFNVEGIVNKQLRSLREQLLGTGEYD